MTAGSERIDLAATVALFRQLPIDCTLIEVMHAASGPDHREPQSAGGGTPAPSERET